jgi:S1-C subfamily serine protease
MMAPMAKKQTLYDILGLAPDAMPIDVALAYEKRLEELRAAPVQDASALALLRQAHEVLVDPKRRAAYDASLVSASERAAAKEQPAPDLVLETDEEEAPRRTIPPVGIAIGIVALLVIAFFALHGSGPPAQKVAAEAPAEAPQAAPPPPQRKSAKDVLALAQASVGRLESFEMSGRAVPLGLAIAIEPAAMLATCHGIPGGAQLAVVDGAENRSATLAVVDETLDLCRLSVAAPPLVPLALAEHDAKAGDAIYALGANAAGELAVTEGRVKGLIPDARGPMYELSMPVAPNGSGGPVFDAYGKLVGIATTATGHGPGVSLAIPASWLARMRSREKAS